MSFPQRAESASVSIVMLNSLRDRQCLFNLVGVTFTTQEFQPGSKKLGGIINKSLLAFETVGRHTPGRL